MNHRRHSDIVGAGAQIQRGADHRAVVLLHAVHQPAALQWIILVRQVFLLQRGVVGEATCADDDFLGIDGVLLAIVTFCLNTGHRVGVLVINQFFSFDFQQILTAGLFIVGDHAVKHFAGFFLPVAVTLAGILEFDVPDILVGETALRSAVLIAFAFRGTLAVIKAMADQPVDRLAGFAEEQLQKILLRVALGEVVPVFLHRFSVDIILAAVVGLVVFRGVDAHRVRGDAGGAAVFAGFVNRQNADLGGIVAVGCVLSFSRTHRCGCAGAAQADD